MEFYQYLPLTPGQIRIFTLLPSRDVGSAAWALATLRPQLKPTLQSALERHFWIDAIYIDQNNRKERDHQLTVMGDIYRKCEADLAWLENPPGQEGGGSWTHALLAKGLEFVRIEVTRGRTIESFSDPGLDAGQQLWLRTVFTTPRLWSRVWIVQEFACAPDVLLLGGGKQLSWDALRTFLDLAPSWDDIDHWPWGRAIYENNFDQDLFPLAEIEKQHERMRGGRDESTIFEVLARFSDRELTKPEDRVYGLLGLVSPLYRRLAVHGADDAATVFIKATAEIIRQSQNADILCQSPWERRGVPQCSRIGPRTTNLPSWAVDFGASGLSRDVGRTYRSRELMYAARGILAAGGDLEKWCVQDGSVLQLRGALISKIGRRPRQPPGALSEVTPDWWGNELTQGEYTVTQEPRFEALWRTMVTDCQGYPMERLQTEDIKRENAMWKSILSGEEQGRSVYQSRFVRMWSRIEQNWEFQVSEDSLFVMARKHVREGDYIAVIEGAKVPLILQMVRPDRFEIVSPTYVHGCMDGDALVRAVTVDLLIV